MNIIETKISQNHVDFTAVSGVNLTFLKEKFTDFSDRTEQENQPQ